MSDFKPRFRTSGIGSVPFARPDQVMDLISGAAPALPFWPQLVKRSPWENMGLQFTKGLPALKIVPEESRVQVDPEADPAEALTAFYEADLGGDLDAFGLTDQTAAGFFALLELARANPDGIDRLKGQVTGPVTFCLGVKDLNDQAVLYNPVLKDAYARGLGLCGAWQVREMAKGFGAPLIFVDEPSLTGFGSAFMALEAEGVISLLNATFGPIHEAGGLCGVHVCGNTDWSTILKTDLDVVNFDAFGFGQGFILYADEIKAFLERGGVIAWGIVPTLNYTGQETLEELVRILTGLIDHLVEKGLDRDLIAAQSMITPSCGMGSRTEDEAREILSLLKRTGAAFREGG